jgi:hypothetical protein
MPEFDDPFSEFDDAFSEFDYADRFEIAMVDQT